MSDQEVDEYNFKVLVVGESGVGKTSIIQRYTRGHFHASYKPTLGADFALKIIHWDSQSRIHLQLWDVAGHERYGHMTRVYYRYAMAAFIVYDLSRPDTLNAVLKWLNDLTQNIVTNDEESIPVILLGNKCDLKGVGYDSSYLNTFCNNHGLDGWFPISAKSGENIDEAMSFIISVILSKQLQGERFRPGSPGYNTLTSQSTAKQSVQVCDTDGVKLENSASKECKSCC